MLLQGDLKIFKLCLLWSCPSESSRSILHGSINFVFIFFFFTGFYRWGKVFELNLGNQNSSSLLVNLPGAQPLINPCYNNVIVK